MSQNGEVIADQLKLFIERIEKLAEEKQAIADDIKDVYAELKATGYDARTTRTMVKLRKMDRDARAEKDALEDTYRAALNLD